MFKHWRHYLKNVQHQIFVFTNHHNLKKFMKITKFSSRQIRWIQNLSRYNFRIDYRQNKKNSTNALFRRSNLMQENENVREKNRRIIHHFQKLLQLQNDNVKIMRITCKFQKKIERSKSQIVVQYNVDWRTLMIDETYVIERSNELITIRNVIISKQIYDEKIVKFFVDLISQMLFQNSFVVTFRKKLIIFNESDEHWAKKRNSSFWRQIVCIKTSSIRRIAKMSW